MLKLGLIGSGGRMGRTIWAQADDAEDLAITATADKDDDLSLVFDNADVVIDFAPPGFTADHAGRAAAAGLPYVVGTTGLSEADHAALDSAGDRIALVQAGNFSLGVAMMTRLVEEAARALGPQWDIEILEMHHRHKVDAPSGTATMLGEAAAKGRGQALQEVAQRVRDGVTGPRPEGEIGFQSLRGGAVIGEHQVIFAGAAERLEISHKAENRGLFADGALTAARFVATASPGRYRIQDLLGLT